MEFGIARARLSALQVEVSVCALLAVPADDVGLAEAVAGVAVADGQRGLLVEVGADGVALGRNSIDIIGTSQNPSVIILES